MSLASTQTDINNITGFKLFIIAQCVLILTEENEKKSDHNE